MGKKNNHKNVAPAVEETVENVVEFVDEPVELTIEPLEKVVGIVSGCRQLNVRKAPRLDAEILCWVSANSELEVNTAKSTDEWLHVCTAAGVTGYCMSKYVFIKQ